MGQGQSRVGAPRQVRTLLVVDRSRTDPRALTRTRVRADPKQICRETRSSPPIASRRRSPRIAARRCPTNRYSSHPTPTAWAGLRKPAGVSTSVSIESPNAPNRPYYGRWQVAARAIIIRVSGVRVPPAASPVAVGFQPSARIAVRLADRLGRSPNDVSQARRTNGSQPDPTAEATVTPEVAAILRRPEKAGIDPRRVAVALGLPYTALAGFQRAPARPESAARGHASSGR